MEFTLSVKSEQIKKFNQPWDHYIIDNFLPRNQFAKMQQDVCEAQHRFSKIENDPFDLNYMFLPQLDLAKFFLRSEFREFLEKITGNKLEIYQKGLVQLRLMTPSSPPMTPHVDDQAELSLVCLWYLSNWSENKGGELNLLKSECSLPSDVSSKVIEPKANRMVLFFSKDTHWHSVNKVKLGNRYSVISEWIVKG